VSVRGTFHILEACPPWREAVHPLRRRRSLGIWFYPQHDPLDEPHATSSSDESAVRMSPSSLMDWKAIAGIRRSGGLVFIEGGDLAAGKTRCERSVGRTKDELLQPWCGRLRECGMSPHAHVENVAEFLFVVGELHDNVRPAHDSSTAPASAICGNARDIRARDRDDAPACARQTRALQHGQHVAANFPAAPKMATVFMCSFADGDHVHEVAAAERRRFDIRLGGSGRALRIEEVAPNLIVPLVHVRIGDVIVALTRWRKSEPVCSRSGTAVARRCPVIPHR